MQAEVRLLVASALLGGWLALFLLGRVAGGLIHLMLVAALVLMPWRARRVQSTMQEEEPR